MSVGELYKRLVVLPPRDYHTYYQKVKDTLEEAKEEIPDVWEDDAPWNLEAWFERWFGNE